MSNFIPIVFLGLILIMTVHYGQTMMASTDAGVNLNGTAYNTTYNQEVKSTVATMTFITIIEYLVAIGALVAALFLLIPSTRNNI